MGTNQLAAAALARSFRAASGAFLDEGDGFFLIRQASPIHDHVYKMAMGAMQVVLAVVPTLYSWQMLEKMLAKHALRQKI